MLVVLVLFAAAPADAEFGYLRTFGCTSAGYGDPRSIGDAESIAVPLGGDVFYVLDNNYEKPLIRKYAADGTLRASWGPPNGEASWGSDPRIAVTPDGVLVAGHYPDLSRLQYTRYVVSGASAQMTDRWVTLDQLNDLAFVKLVVRDLSVESAVTLVGVPNSWFVALHPIGVTETGQAERPQGSQLFRTGTGVAAAGGALWVADNDSHQASPSRLTRFELPRVIGSTDLVETGRTEFPFEIGDIDRGLDAVWVMATNDTASHLTSVGFDGRVTGQYEMTQMGVPNFSSGEVGVDGKGRVYVLRRAADEITVLGPGGSRFSLSQRPDPCKAGTTPLTRMDLSVPPRQLVLEKRVLEIDVRCNTACSASAGGRIAIAGRAHTLPLVRDVNSKPAKRQALRMRLSRATAAIVRRAIVSGRRVTARIQIKATDKSGKTLRRTVTLALGSKPVLVPGAPLSGF